MVRRISEVLVLINSNLSPSRLDIYQMYLINGFTVETMLNRKKDRAKTLKFVGQTLAGIKPEFASEYAIQAYESWAIFKDLLKLKEVQEKLARR